jgi:hypothetical protein
MASLDQSDVDPARQARRVNVAFLAHLVTDDGLSWRYDPTDDELPASPADTAMTEPASCFALVIDQFEEIITGRNDALATRNEALTAEAERQRLEAERQRAEVERQEQAALAQKQIADEKRLKQNARNSAPRRSCAAPALANWQRTYKPSLRA